jgi:hypothetical protein
VLQCMSGFSDSKQHPERGVSPDGYQVTPPPVSVPPALSGMLHSDPLGQEGQNGGTELSRAIRERNELQGVVISLTQALKRAEATSQLHEKVRPVVHDLWRQSCSSCGLARRCDAPL